MASAIRSVPAAIRRTAQKAGQASARSRAAAGGPGRFQRPRADAPQPEASARGGCFRFQRRAAPSRVHACALDYDFQFPPI